MVKTVLQEFVRACQSHGNRLFKNLLVPGGASEGDAHDLQTRNALDARDRMRLPGISLLDPCSLQSSEANMHTCGEKTTSNLGCPLCLNLHSHVFGKHGRLALAASEKFQASCLLVFLFVLRDLLVVAHPLLDPHPETATRPVPSSF